MQTLYLQKEIRQEISKVINSYQTSEEKQRQETWDKFQKKNVFCPWEAKRLIYSASGDYLYQETMIYKLLIIWFIRYISG